MTLSLPRCSPFETALLLQGRRSAQNHLWGGWSPVSATGSIADSDSYSLHWKALPPL
uniref:Uncharacterized protein n=1 Tax=Arundo donax TaxID=35708 RepID=A0A0A9HIP8_ARUDO